MRRMIVALAVTLATAAPLRAQGDADRDGVQRAMLDYLEGFYEGDTAKLVRSIRPEVDKFGFWRQRDSTSYVAEGMPWADFLSYARGVKEKNRQAPATAPREVVIYEVQNQTASGKVVAWWGTDYILLGKYDGRWMIRQVMWQSPPR